MFPIHLGAARAAARGVAILAMAHAVLALPLAAQVTTTVASPGLVREFQLDEQLVHASPSVRILISGPSITDSGQVAPDALRAYEATCRESSWAHRNLSLPIGRDARRWLVAPDSVSVVALAASAPETACERYWNESQIGLWLGVSFGNARSAPDEILDVTVSRDGVPVSTGVRTTTAYVWAGAAWDSSARRREASVPIDAFAPEIDGTLPTIRVSTSLRGRHTPDVWQVPAEGVRQLTLNRLAREVADGPTGVARLPLALRSEAGRGVLLAPATTITGSIRAMARGQLFDDNAETALARTLRLAEMAYALHDSASARFLVREELRAHPCLTLGQLDSSSPLARDVSRYRAADACMLWPVTRTLARGLALPGGGAWVQSRARGAASTALVMASALYAARLQHQSDDDYRRYQASTDPAAVMSYYNSSVANQHAARQWLMGAGALWLADVLFETALASHHNQGVLADRF